MIKIALLSNINLDSFQFKLKKDYSLFLPKGYNTWRQELLDKSSDFYNFQPQSCFLIFDGNDFFSSIRTNIQESIDDIFVSIEYALETIPQCHFFISDLDINGISINDSKKINEEYVLEYSWLKRLQICMDRFKNAYRFPLKNCIIQYGRKYIYSPKMWYLASNRFSISGINVIVEQMKEYMRPFFIPSKKCMVLDLDNTLWGGVIAEDGIDGIQLDDHGEGSRFYDFQSVIKEIHERGVLLAIISKNNRDDVEKVFTHPKMLLKETDFVAMKINWNRKSDNIAQIAHELNIGMDAFVFIDDNPVEREEMRQGQPDVIVADFPEDTTALAQFALKMYNNYFYSWNLSEEDIKKTQMYYENTIRQADRNSFFSLEDFLINMNMKLSVKKVTAEYIVRVVQMIQKTNQFNLTTKRYSEDVITNMLTDSNVLLFIGHVQDNYGDNGNSILIIVRLCSPDIAEIDSFLMSCRIMNRTIEFGFLYEVEKILNEKGIQIIRAQYIKTAKNSPACLFFDEAGYSLISATDTEKFYELSIHGIRNAKKCYTVIERNFV